jgi:heme A synthase
MSSKTKWYAIGGGFGALVLLGLLVWGLYALGDRDQSALERFRDIAVIFIVLLFGITVILLAAIVAALGYLTWQIKDRVIPMLEELTGTMQRVRGTAEFMTEEAVKPILGVAGTYAKIRAMTKVVTGRSTKPPTSLLKK